MGPASTLDLPFSFLQKKKRYSSTVTAFTSPYWHVSRVYQHLHQRRFPHQTQEWCSRVSNRRADLEVFNIRVAQMTCLLVDVSLCHDFTGAGRDGLRTHGKLRNRDNPAQILESAAAQKIRDYRTTYRRNRQVAFLPACMSASGASSTVNSCAYSSSWQTRRPTAISRHSDTSCTSKSFVTVAASSSSKTGAPDGMCSDCGDT
jgi:hypothetical protein